MTRIETQEMLEKIWLVGVSFILVLFPSIIFLLLSYNVDVKVKKSEIVSMHQTRYIPDTIDAGWNEDLNKKYVSGSTDNG